jgi:cell pole-organizing protein PopZ
MSKPDAASGSLESILASIRKSLSEQSVEAESEQQAASAEPAKDAAARKGGLTQRLAGASNEGPIISDAKAGDDLADLLEDQPAAPRTAAKQSAASPATGGGPAPTPPSATAPAAAGPPEEDPLWFLTKRDEPAAAEGAQAAEPILTPPEVVRATMPPFFGSTAEVVKPDAAQPDASAPTRQPPRVPEAPPSVEVAPAATANAPSARVSVPTPPSGPALHNGRAAEPAEAKGAVLGDALHTRALEAAVIDLLKPMLAQWLDRNMPRLVAEALKEEAARARAAAEGGAKKAQ